MNPLPPNADELVSAYLDGQAAPDEIAIVESSPELMQRVDSLRSIGDLLGAPVEAPPEQKERHISAALDAFDALFDAEATQDAAPALTIAPPRVDDVPEPTEQPPAVTSLSDARDRRRSRRFNPGVIAAAVAAVLLFVVVAALGFGGGTNSDVATTAATDAASEPVSSADDASAMDESAEDAVQDADDDAGSALSELQSAAPSNEAATGEAADAAEAMDDEEAMADEESAVEEVEEAAMDDAAADFDAGADSDEEAPEAASRDGVPFLFADLEFADQEGLLSELEGFTIDELDQQARELDQGLFPGCQAEVERLAQVESPTLVGQTFIGGEPVEIHRIVDEAGEIAFIITDVRCAILPPGP